DDPRYATRAGRLTDPGFREAFESVMESARELTVAEALARLDRGGVPAVAGLSPEEVVDHPQFVANRTLVAHDDEVLGPTVEPRHPARFSRTPARPPGAAPRHGRSDDDVLDSIGVTGAEREALRAAGILGRA